MEASKAVEWFASDCTSATTLEGSGGIMTFPGEFWHDEFVERPNYLGMPLYLRQIYLDTIDR